MKSMTGYAKETFKTEDIEVTAEIKSLNGKALRIRFSIPRLFNPLITEIQSVIGEVVKRGEVDLYLFYRLSPELVPEVSVNYAQAEKYLKAVQKISGVSGKEITVTFKDLLAIPEIFQKEEMDVEPFREAVISAVKKAVLKLDEVRRIEGEKIKRYLEDRLKTIEETLLEIEEDIEGIEGRIFERLKEKVEKLLKDVGVEEEEFLKRVEMEVAFLAEKQDVSEEVSRLKMHLKRFRELIDSDEPIGKTLDFLCQEMHREINTLGNKLKEIDVTEPVLKIKSEIARIKEQVQNVE
ncbi:TIGR00255 family protein [Desulfurobacterium pacificum]|uniref:TIGR00255 family protein n=1 Tax=Desulfurobacterium pacificum TaxID=240166 RepID=A0ABY1NJW7_9BACT|nr:YicC/YloC family endoribonuclease [Desulfurobacterium pacificum]SMP10999.1 TIGR00255 family protein [Desulfurobacterium pacificum]